MKVLSCSSVTSLKNVPILKLRLPHVKNGWPEILPKDTLPKDILPNGHFDKLYGHFAANRDIF